MAEKPKTSNSTVQNELEKAEKQFDAFDKNVKELTMDRMNAAPKLEEENQTKLSSKDLKNSKDIYLKPKRQIMSREKFNEKFREKYEFDKQYVNFVAENKEIIGETIPMWSKPYPGLPAEEWEIPVNKPVWAPRYVAEQIKSKKYHRLTMQNAVTGNDQMGQYYGTIVADVSIQRLDAYPVSNHRSNF